MYVRVFRCVSLQESVRELLKWSEEEEETDRETEISSDSRLMCV